ncbi:50S ribosomal protein L25/general stress protein Ctc [Labrys wisconsinensis]|uniref:Large ribosomal subunit protein bL25 n=1 Tax=Labrys wisconsinensis TaxID=425677 RepID=A0ABU0JH82_9HYPH|nr:50S ribosomal protein L25/general stress protein Ctc [Labrys wisconsinensis]MDQ0473652.1 large subunit ribosomal protein L25 [Labrys wisconsinensis]
MSAVKQITATARERVGKGAARAVRRSGKIPAVIYGAGKPPLPIALDDKTMTLLVYAGHFLTTVFEIDVAGEKTRVIPRDYALDPVKDTVEHVDFLRISVGERIRVDVPVHAVNAGASPGVKRGGSVNIVTHTVTVLAPADAIPGSIDVDVSALDINESLHISQIALPAGVSSATQGDLTLVSIVPPTTETEAAPAADAAAAAPAPEKK